MTSSIPPEVKELQNYNPFVPESPCPLWIETLACMSCISGKMRSSPTYGMPSFWILCATESLVHTLFRNFLLTRSPIF